MKKILIIFLVLYLAAFAINATETISSPGGHAILPANQFFLTKEKINEFRLPALSGDVEKALAISNHYAMSLDDEIDAEFWLRVAAERDDCHALREYVRRMTHTPRLNSEARLEIWKERESKACKH